MSSIDVEVRAANNIALGCGTSEREQFENVFCGWFIGCLLRNVLLLFVFLFFLLMMMVVMSCGGGCKSV